MDINVAVAMLGVAMAVVGMVMGLCMVIVVVWAWACGGRKMGGGGVRRFNVQCSMFKVQQG